MVRFFNGILVGVIALFSTYLVLNNVSFQQTEAATDTVDLSIAVDQYLAFSIDTPGKTIDFGTLNPGTPACSATPSVATATTNAENGYTLAVHDGSDTDSALRKGVSSTYIPDNDGTIDVPSAWVNGTDVGVGIGMWAADNAFEAKWCTGGEASCTTVCDDDINYAGIPAAAGIVHTVTGFRAAPDTSTWSWQVDAPNTQETGNYSGTVTFTALPVVL